MAGRKRLVRKTGRSEEVAGGLVASAEPAVASPLGFAEVKKSFLEKMAPVMLVALVVMAFILGAMWSRIKYLESGGKGSGAVAVNSKYKNLMAAFEAYAKEIKLDQKRFMACIKNGDKKQVVEADAAEAKSLGVQGTPGFFINGRFLPGAFPFESFKEVIDREIAGKGSNKAADYSESLVKSGFVAEPKKIALGNSAFKGASNPVVTVVEYSDFQCPFCMRVLPTVERIMEEYEGKVKFVYKHLPLDQLHPNARLAAEASECAGDQGKFWEWHDLVFKNQAEWSGLPRT